MAWRPIPIHHLTALEKAIEHVFGGCWIWCPEVTQERKYKRGQSR